jgi:hypothetical protein
VKDGAPGICGRAVEDDRKSIDKCMPKWRSFTGFFAEFIIRRLTAPTSWIKVYVI